MKSPFAYHWPSSSPTHAHDYLLPLIRRLLSVESSDDRVGGARRALDIGCGNGYLTAWLASQGWDVVGVEPSLSGVQAARKAYPNLRFENFVPDSRILDRLGSEPFDLVLSTEVVEHVYAPREWASSAFQSLKPGGCFLCSTPYHGYLKNLLLSATGKMDSHFTALWDGGHIKFWSRSTLSQLLLEQGFVDLRFTGAGRMPWLWKSMIMRALKPAV